MSNVIEIVSDNKEDVATKGDEVQQTISSNNNAISSTELPFLVTRWLSNYNKKDAAGGIVSSEKINKDAIQKIHNAAFQLSSAFSDLGAFGTASRPLLRGETKHPTQHVDASPEKTRNASFADLLRQWPGIPSNHLESMLETTASNSIASLSAAEEYTNCSCLVDKASEDKSKPMACFIGDIGRQLGTTSVNSREEVVVSPPPASLMQSSLLLTTSLPYGDSNIGKSLANTNKSSGLVLKHLNVPVESDYQRAGQTASGSVQNLLSLRAKIKEEENEMQMLNKSIATQEAAQTTATKERNDCISQKADATTSLLENPITQKASDEAFDHVMARLDEIKSRERNCARVIAQLKRKQIELVNSRNYRCKELHQATTEAKSTYRDTILLGKKYRDPFQQHMTSSLPVPLELHGSRKNRLTYDLMSRQYGGGGSWKQSASVTRRLLGRIPSLKSSSQSRKHILFQRLSHSITTNAHLAYPAYCLRFDRTGRYFISGADDFLAKLFYLGPGRSCDVGQGEDGGRRLKCDYGANERGAVLVCTLRGHTGVICDIDVSVDNALLATASDDGDCRIWGLRDGCPVAILRGHRDGANMVSWSFLSPYRIVTISTDGLARMWDVREAALKRYGAHVGKRLDYLLNLTEAEKNVEEAELMLDEPCQAKENTTLEAAVLPPLPQRESALQSLESAEAVREDQARQDVVVPPLPPGVRPLGGGARGDVANAQAQNREGEFVANDLIDEGVRLIAMLQHGDANEASEQAPSRRARRKAIKVLCIARCPLGGHFATASEDGLARIWADDEEDRLEIVDKRYVGENATADGRKSTIGRQGSGRSTRATSIQSLFRNVDVPSTSSLLATLQGHVNAITDLHYSNTGDRILTASQKDGVVRIWSLGRESATDNISSYLKGNPFSDLKQILIRLTGPSTHSEPLNSQSNLSRRRGARSTSTSRSSGMNVCCDVAVWTYDDSKIITSQCNLKQANSSVILPGSQYLLVWDSQTGQCLIGMSGAHSMACPVVLPHPFDASILCSAGADGLVHLWDLDSGKCILAHENKVVFGPVEAVNKGKTSGILDGAFSPDGLKLVLTDDCGRITVFDSLHHASPAPSWMKEQYFANDFYELFYSENGYCIERGSQQPPHLAPRAVRCNHSGVPYPERINDTFLDLVGPLPLPEQECRLERESIRSRGTEVRSVRGPLLRNVQDERTIIMGVLDPLRTIIICGLGGNMQEHVEGRVQGGTTESQISQVGRDELNRNASQRNIQRNTSFSGRALSSNWRWRDYEDVLGEENANDNAETDDEDFVVSNRPFTGNLSDGDDFFDAEDDELDDDELDDEDELFAERSTRNTRRTNATMRQHQRPARSQLVNRRSHTSQRVVASDERPTRVSARQRRRESGPYEDPGSDDEFVEEFLSTNNTPSGPYAEDYNAHFFRMPDASIVKGKWLQRLESKSSYNMTKDYAPQVGDFVVYIPRAHYETIQNFPTLDAPWKRWPRNSAWPVVRCCIRDVRYRFPFEAYYSKHNRYLGVCNSVVAILTLEITGIPETSEDRWFPWPKPYFVSRQTRSSNLTFEVSLFENEFADFIIPEQMYLWRIETLEAAIAERDYRENGLQVVVYFEPEHDEEDAEMESYDAHIVQKNFPNERETDLHTKGSGFNSLAVRYETNELYQVSPWELSLKDKDHLSPPPPSMSDETKKAVIRALTKIERHLAVEWFSQPVNMNRYSDYLNRVEVPMDYSFIRSRVATGYYSNKLSVLFDARLVKDNCIKYNGEGTDLSKKAVEIYGEFEREIINVEEAAPLTRAGPTDSIRQSEIDEDQVHPPSLQSTCTARTRSSLEGCNNILDYSEGCPEENDQDQVLPRRSSRGRSLESLSSLELLPPPRSTESRSLNGGRGETSGVTRLKRNNGPRRGKRTSAGDKTDCGEKTRPERNINRRKARNEASENHRPVGPTRNAIRRRNMQRDLRDSSENDNERDEDNGPSKQSSVVIGASPNDEQIRGGDDDDDSEGLSVEDEDDTESSYEEVVESSKLSSRTVSASQPASPTQRGSGRVVAKKLQSYHSPEEEEERPESDHRKISRRSPRSTCVRINMRVPSEEEEPLSGEEEEENISSSSEEIISQRTCGGSSKRRKATCSSRNTKKSKVSVEGRALPELQQWPEIEVKDITKVVNAVLDRMSASDQDGMFAIPVTETYPYMTEEYNDLIENPMDFRTIQEERLPMYQSISRLQEDLVLVFKNCVTFNSDTPDLRDYAISMWEMLNDVFRDACKELGVLLPHWW